MPRPKTALASLRPDLAGSFMEFDLEAEQMKMIAHKVMPVRQVGSPSSSFGVLTLEELLHNATTRRSPEGRYNRVGMRFEDMSYTTHEEGLEQPVDDRNSRAYRDFFDAELMASRRLKNTILREQEKRVAAALFNTTTWTGSTLTTPVGSGVKWSVPASGKPVSDVIAAKRKVFASSGMWPNAVWMSYGLYLHVKQNNEVRDAIASSGAGSSVLLGDITVQQVAAAFEVPYLFVAGAAKNTAKENQTAVIAEVWDSTMCMVGLVSRSEDLAEPCVGRILHWDEDGSMPLGKVESYYEEQVRGTVIRVRHDVTEKVIRPEMAHLITACA